MASSEDDQLDRNACLFLAVREKINISEKLAKVTIRLNEGGDVNAVDANNCHNTPIHMAVIRAEIDIVRLLIDRSAKLHIKNSNGKTPLDIARELNNEKGQELVVLLEAAGCGVNELPAVKVNTQNNQPQKVTKKSKKKQFLYSKRTGTSGVCGQLYETKLLSLVLLRALNDDDIEVFNLGTNINGVGDLDDICLRYEVKGHSKPILVFLQAKHREDRDKGRLTVEDLTSVSGDFSLRKYFDSYLKIKSKFQPNNEDDMFDGEFSNVECNLIIYTPAKDFFTKKKIDKALSVKVNDLINTGDNTEAFQFNYDDNDLDYLTKMAVEKRLTDLATEFLYLIMSKNKLQVIMAGELITRYHAVMRREVLQLLKIQENSQEYRTWKFHPDFFIAGSDYLDVIRKTFCNELSTSICDKSDITKEDRNNFKSLVQDPCAYTISKLIGKLMTYDGKKLQLKEVKSFKQLFPGNELELLKADFNDIDVTEDVVREAIVIKLESLEFKLPLAFGNLDMMIRGDDEKVRNTIVRVVDKLKPLFKSGTKTIEINDDIVGPNKLIEEGVINIFGTAVGNLLVFDIETKMLMFDIDNTILPVKAKALLDEFKKYFSDYELRGYRININKNKFPKDSFHGDEYDKRQARDFLNKIWFYANQAKEDGVESILKKEINKHYNNEENQNRFTFRIHSDAIFLRSHDEVQKWWMRTGKVPYLSRSSELFEQAKLAVIDNPLLMILNSMYNLKIQNLGIKFNEESVHALELHTITQRLFNVLTKANSLSGIKIMQYFEKQDKCTFIDFDYVLSLPLIDYNKMLQELGLTDKSHTLIIVYEKLKYYEGLCNKLIQVIKKFNGSKIILVTDSDLADEVKSEDSFKDQYQSVTDDRTYLFDLDEPSKMKVLNETTIVFQGEELTLLPLLDIQAQSLVRTDILNKMIYKNKIEIGHELLDKVYQDIKDGYIDRTLSRDDTYQVKTLNDEVNDGVVIVSGRSGMGKSALLTHLSLQTKLVNPLPWIVRINLPDYEKEFSRWQEDNITIDLRVVLHFLCKIALKNIDMRIKFELTEHNENIIVSEVDEKIDPLALFELELFLHLYNGGNVIFLFDDFNAMCPHYEKEVLEILKRLKDEGKRLWVMTCEYRHTKMALEKEFGTPYKLDRLNNTEKKTLLERFFRNNIRLERLNYDQFENVTSFMKFMSRFRNKRLVSDPDRELVPFFSLTFHLIYVLAAEFFQSEINRASPSVFRNRMKENFKIDLDQYTVVDDVLGRNVDDEELELAGTPLHLYLAANYFKCRLEDSISFLLDEQEAKNKWDFVINTFTMYQHFVEAHMSKIFSREETNDQAIVSTFQTTRKDFFEKNKKLGLFALCRENDLTKILKQDEINDIKDTIEKIKRGEDRSTLVNCVVNDVPRFAHLVFAEYFAIEYLTDLMKLVADDSDSNAFKCASLWQAILNLLLFHSPPGLRKAFNYKLQNDSTLAKLANSDVCREVMFELLLKPNRSSVIIDEAGPSTRETPIQEAMADGLVNLVNLFLSSAQGKLHRGNVDDFLSLLKRSGDMFVDFGKEYAETLSNVLESVEQMDLKKLGEIFTSGKLTEVPLRHANDYRSSETASELERHVEATTTHIPALTHHVQQLVQKTGGVKEVAKALLETGMQLALKDLLTRLREE